jgi:hypothetical protein
LDLTHNSSDTKDELLFVGGGVRHRVPLYPMPVAVHNASAR